MLYNHFITCETLKKTEKGLCVRSYVFIILLKERTTISLACLFRSSTFCYKTFPQCLAFKLQNTLCKIVA